MLGGIFSGVGSVISAGINADAIKTATQMQIDALQKQRTYVYNNLNPAVIAPMASAQDALLAQNRLALQGQIDPNLLNSRYAAEAGISSQLGQIGAGPASAVANTAAGEALAATPGMDQAKAALIDAANKELKAGATLPPDVQAQLVQTGLEQSGMATGGASGQGMGGTVLRTILGTAGLNLQAQRQQQATNLITQAQNLTNSRAQILQGLFPNLNSTQLANLGATQGALSQSNSMVPQAGLSGTDVANLWLARVGATNSLTQQAAQVGAQGAMGMGQAYGQLAGGLTQAGGQLAGMIPGWFSNSPSIGGGTPGAVNSGPGTSSVYSGDSFSTD
jgi:hypothetical protein